MKNKCFSLVVPIIMIKYTKKTSPMAENFVILTHSFTQSLLGSMILEYGKGDVTAGNTSWNKFVHLMEERKQEKEKGKGQLPKGPFQAIPYWPNFLPLKSPTIFPRLVSFEGNLRSTL